MRIKLQNLLFVGPLFLGGTSALCADSIEAPEFATRRASEELAKVTSELDALRQISVRGGLGPLKVFEDHEFEQAEFNRAANDHIGTLRALQSFLTITAVPQSGRHLQALKMLGETYEQQGYPGKALRSYRRYVATFVTAREQNVADLIDVMRRMMPLVNDQNTIDKPQFQSLLSSVVALQIAEPQRSEMLYLSARSAAQAGLTSMAEQWFERAKSANSDATLKMNSLYFYSLIALSKGNVDQADMLLAEAVQLGAAANPDTHARSLIALGRIALERGHAKRSLKYYQQVDKSLPAYRDALSDLIFVHFSNGDHKTALECAEEYVSKYGKQETGNRIATIRTFLNIRAGTLSGAETELNETETQLSDANVWLKAQMKRDMRLTWDELKMLDQRMNGHIKQSTLVHTALNQFGALAEMNQRTDNLRSELYELVMTMGSSKFSQVNPSWQKRSSRIDQLSRRVLQIGDELVQAERPLYEEQLSEVDRYRLNFLREQRESFQTPDAEFRRDLTPYRHWIMNSSVTQRASTSEARLRQRQAELAAVSFVAAQNENLVAMRSRTKTLQARQGAMSQAMGKLNLALREDNLRDLTNQASFNSTKALMTRAGNSLYEESSILSKYRDKQAIDSRRFMATNFDKAWKDWSQTAKVSYEEIGRLGIEAKGWFAGLMTRVDALEERCAQVAAKISDQKNALELGLGRSSNFILSHYENGLNQNVSRVRKWKGDVSWLKFEGLQKNTETEQKKIELEREVVKSGIASISEGGIKL
jgi:tetratricopeptide (TPR) repeat protein